MRLQTKLMVLLLSLDFLGGGGIARAAPSSQPSKIVPVAEPLGVRLGVGVLLFPLPKSSDGQLFELGYRKKKWAFDFRGLLLKSNYSRFFVSKDRSTVIADPIAMSQQLWNGSFFEIGFSYIASSFLSLGQRFQERSRMGLCVLGSVRDETFQVSYRPSLFSLESGIEYRLFEKTPLNFQAGLNWRFGYLVVSDPGASLGNRIPTSTVTLNTGLFYEF